jgi:hypothetical protein
MQPNSFLYPRSECNFFLSCNAPLWVIPFSLALASQRLPCLDRVPRIAWSPHGNNGIALITLPPDKKARNYTSENVSYFVIVTESGCYKNSHPSKTPFQKTLQYHSVIDRFRQIVIIVMVNSGYHLNSLVLRNEFRVCLVAVVAVARIYHPL